MATATSFSRIGDGIDPLSTEPSTCPSSGLSLKDVPTNLSYKRDAFIRQLDWSDELRPRIEESLDWRRTTQKNCVITTIAVPAIGCSFFKAIGNVEVLFLYCIFGFMLIWYAALETRAPDQELQREMMFFYRDKYNVDLSSWGYFDAPQPYF